ncbi:Pentraxin-related protein PTX3 [Operophtera brumata]|uniref:Pentraxin-related protein PTX3 n=1 Tax=Operophtera brumata TaxID=104452 RepID=A0A0L7L332_OPEBR|nr:Pentraxin-related protein PTX3 [Operophtera brumata]
MNIGSYLPSLELWARYGTRSAHGAVHLTPPLREFTFCLWIRVYDLEKTQSIFSYVAKGNNRVVRLWLDTGGRSMNLSIKGRVTSYFPVEIVKDVWHHMCLSYQSDYGAWALYIDSRLASCEESQSTSNGFEGEIFGASMILISTIERNVTLRNNPQFEQTVSPQNNVKNADENLNNYIIFSHLQSDDIHNNFENIFVTPAVNSKSYEKKETPNSIVKLDVGVGRLSRKPKIVENSYEKDIYDATVSDKFLINGKDKMHACKLANLTPFKEKIKFPTSPKSEVAGSSTQKISLVTEHETLPLPDFIASDKFHLAENHKMVFWNLPNRAPTSGKFKFTTIPKSEQSDSGERGLPVLFEHETPPPQGPSINYFDKGLKIENLSLTDSAYKLKESPTKSGKKSFSKKRSSVLSEIETPPPINQDTKVYGQWTSTKYPHRNALNFLKSMNLQNKVNNMKKVPLTIPITKISDSYPYASNFKVSKLYPPPQFSKRRIVEKQFIVKRYPQINVQTLQNDLRSNILKMLAQTRPQHVEIKNRGKTHKPMHHRFYRKVNDGSFEKFNSVEDVKESKPLMMFIDEKKNQRYFVIPNQKFKSEYPSLKSLEYLVDNTGSTESQSVTDSKDLYTKIFANANKWHNVKSYNNDYTPRRLNMQLQQSEIGLTKQNPSNHLKYHHDKLVDENVDSTIVRGRQLAIEVSNQSKDNTDSVTSLKFNHRYFPNHDHKVKMRPGLKANPKQNIEAQSFNQHVQIEKSLNERHLLGGNENPKKQTSFTQELNFSIPDYNISVIDNQNTREPSSHDSWICTSVELNNHHLYVQQDESISMSHILSPVRPENSAMVFILQNYKKCSLVDSHMGKNSKLLIDWSITPVRLFGGAYPRTTTDLCGFF